MQKIISFDSLRFLLALFVVIGHTFIVLVRQSNTQLWCLQNLAVDGFFVLSGFLLAVSCAKYSAITTNTFFHTVGKRLRRLWPEYIFAILFTLAISVIFGIHVNASALPLNFMFLSHINKIPGIINGSWYMSVLFWCSVLYIGLLLARKSLASQIMLIFIPFTAFTLIYTTYTGLSLNEYPLMWNTVSSGIFKGLMDMGLGIGAYHISKYLANSDIKLKHSKATFAIIELATLGVLIPLMNYDHLSQKEYFVPLAFAVLVSLLYFRKEYFTKFLSWRIWKIFTPLSYMIFLTYCVMLSILSQYKESLLMYNKYLVYAGVLVMSILIGAICCWLCKKLFNGLSKLIFIKTEPEQR